MNVARLVFVLSSIFLITLSAFFLGLYSYHTGNWAYRLSSQLIGDVQMLLDPDLRKDIPGARVREHLQPARDDAAGVTVNERGSDGSLVFLLGFFDGENQARLVDRDGKPVAKWSLDYFEHFPEESRRACDIQSPLDVDNHGAVLTSAGELVVNYEYCGNVKLDRCGNVLWTLDEKTHHSVEFASGGGYWILGRDEWDAREDPQRLAPFSQFVTMRTVEEDHILLVSETGTVIERRSLPAILYDSGLESVVTAGRGFWGGYAEGELVHANEITELSSELSAAFPMFEAGDLAVSMRGLNLIVVIDRKTWRVKWHQTGPWIRQHDPEFRPDGTISVFNNNTYIIGYDGNRQVLLESPWKTNIMTVDPESRRTRVVYGNRTGQEMLSVIRGQHEILPDGGMLIVEFDAGRVLEVDRDGSTVWEYVNRYDEDHVGEISNARLYPMGHFDVDDWACAG